MASQVWPLTQRQCCDLELLCNGAFAPLTTFMSQSDYQTVVEQSRLADGSLWPIPIVLDITSEQASATPVGTVITLTNAIDQVLAQLQVSDYWEPDKHKEAYAIYGTDDPSHPGVRYLLQHTGTVYTTGTLTPLQSFSWDNRFYDLCATPTQLKAHFAACGWKRIIGFQTRNPLHRAHFTLTQQAMQRYDAHLLLHPVIGPTQPGDLAATMRVACYRQMIPHYPAHTIKLSVLPLAMRMAGPKEALWHALIRKNYGCTHFIVGRDHAGTRDDSTGQPFYNATAAHQYVSSFGDELGLTSNRQ